MRLTSNTAYEFCRSLAVGQRSTITYLDALGDLQGERETMFTAAQWPTQATNHVRSPQ